MKILFLFFVPLITWAQCEGSYYFEDQSSIDNFIRDYGDCDKIDSLEIVLRCSGNRITNFDSLINIKKINYFKISAECSNLSIDGLANLRKVNFFQTYDLDSINSVYQFENLDSIEHLDLSGREISSDLANFKYTEYIAKLTLRGAGNCLGLSATAKSSLKSIAILHGKRDGNLSELINGNYLESLIIRNIENFSVSPPDSLTQISNLSCINSPGIDLTPLSMMKITGAINIINNEESVPIFQNVDTIDIIQLSLLEDLTDFKTKFPNLVKVNSYLSVFESSNLERLGINKIEIPYGKPFSNYLIYTRVRIEENPKLKECEEEFLCEALNAYPDSVILENNGEFCNLDNITEYCKTVSTKEFDNKNIKLYPNPASDYISLDSSIKDFDLYIIINASGQIVQTGHIDSNQINISNLSSGIYSMCFRSEWDYVNLKFVKNSL
jgi:hypothetical protein